jgi:hypothetical protein
MKILTRSCLLILCSLSSLSAFSAGLGNTDSNTHEGCESYAKAQFEKEWGEGMLTDKESATLVTYTSHFNLKLNKCFMLVDVKTSFIKKKSQSFKSIFLEEVPAGKEYGAYVEKGAKYLGKSRQSSICMVENRKCNSKSEFESLVKPYMEE